MAIDTLPPKADTTSEDTPSADWDGLAAELAAQPAADTAVESGEQTAEVPESRLGAFLRSMADRADIKSVARKAKREQRRENWAQFKESSTEAWSEAADAVKEGARRVGGLAKNAAIITIGMGVLGAKKGSEIATHGYQSGKLAIESAKVAIAEAHSSTKESVKARIDSFRARRDAAKERKAKRRETREQMRKDQEVQRQKIQEQIARRRAQEAEARRQQQEAAKAARDAERTARSQERKEKINAIKRLIGAKALAIVTGIESTAKQAVDAANDKKEQLLAAAGGYREALARRSKEALGKARDIGAAARAAGEAAIKTYREQRLYQQNPAEKHSLTIQQQARLARARKKERTSPAAKRLRRK